MTRFQTAAIVLLLVSMIGANPALGADFYEAQLQLGAESLRAGRAQEAADYLRVANFGLLDRTTLLSEGIARLALAESALGRKDDVQKTLARFLLVERQFPSYAKAALDPADRAAFERLLLASVSSESIAAVPSLAAIVPTVSSETAEMTPEQRKRYLEAKASADPTNPEWPLALARDAKDRGDQKGVLRWTDKALRADASNAEAHAMRLQIFTARKDDAKAIAELRAMPDSAWAAIPGVFADAFVVFVRTKNDSQADAVASRLSEADLQRSDVMAATESLQGRKAAAEAAAAALEAKQEPVEAPSESVPAASAPEVPPEPAAASTATTVAAAEAPPVTPPSAPLAGSPDVIDTRAQSSRGSFTSSQDRIGAALTSAKKQMAANQPEEAQKILRDELKRSPESRELRLAMLEASCLARDWRTGVAQVTTVEPFRTTEDRYRFYAAVVLFESGRIEEAKPLMTEAAPHLASSPFVDYYVKLVLGGK